MLLEESEMRIQELRNRQYRVQDRREMQRIPEHLHRQFRSERVHGQSFPVHELLE